MLKPSISIFLPLLHIIGIYDAQYTPPFLLLPPQRVCFYLREELIKFERYQKQFHFLYDNDIETSSQLIEMKQTAEDRISELASQRSRLYHKPDAKGAIADINIELKDLCAKVRMCNNILIESERVNERYNETQRLEQEAMAHKKHKKKDNDDEHTR